MHCRKLLLGNLDYSGLFEIHLNYLIIAFWGSFGPLTQDIMFYEGESKAEKCFIQLQNKGGKREKTVMKSIFIY